MKAKLISYSRPPVLTFDSNKNETMDLVSFCARVSAPDNQDNYESGAKLIKYLIKHQHWSPLEMVSVCMEVETTRDIARQMLRHRSFAFQEYSQRYADPTKDLEFVLREARLQDTKNRQNSVEIDDPQLQEEWNEYQRRAISAANSAYQWAITKGIAKEQARVVLPEGNTVSRLYINGTMRSWIHYIELRQANGTQKEHMDIAKACGKIIAEIFPIGEL